LANKRNHISGEQQWLLLGERRTAAALGEPIGDDAELETDEDEDDPLEDDDDDEDDEDDEDIEAEDDPEDDEDETTNPRSEPGKPI
jgi:hypothetical protein